MIYSYRSDHSNQVHQVVISVSKHFFIKKDGGLSYQKKPFETSLAKAGMQNRRHVVHYLIRDHFSGTFYAEVFPADNMSDIAEFLYRSWSQKPKHPFCGIPDFITIAATVTDHFPNIHRLLDAYGIGFVKATSGFQSGIRDLRTWEEEVRTRPGLTSFEQLQSMAPGLSRLLCEGRFNKLAKWKASIKEVRVPGSQEEFLAVYRGELAP